MNWTLLINSLLVSALTTLLAVASGFFGSAVLWRDWSGVGRRWWIGGAVIGLALPPFLVTGLLAAPARFDGRLAQPGLPLDIYSLGRHGVGSVADAWPISLLLILGAWQRPRARPTGIRTEIDWLAADTPVCSAAGAQFACAVCRADVCPRAKQFCRAGDFAGEGISSGSLGGIQQQLEKSARPWQ